MRRIGQNPIAKAVKLADIRHNSDSSRLPEADPEILRYYEAKYKAALEVLK